MNLGLHGSDGTSREYPIDDAPSIKQRPWRCCSDTLIRECVSKLRAARAVLRLLYTIAAVPKPGGSILYGDGVEDFGDGLFQDHGGASFGGAEQLLQLRPGLLDRVEIG